MKRIISISLAALLLLCAAVSCGNKEKAGEATTSDLAGMFSQPPMQYRPYVWWHWMGPNFSKEGIRKDLEAMKEAGIAGATIFNIASAVQETHAPVGNNPWPEQTYRSEAYWEALEYAAQVAQELGLKIGLHNTPGYSTTGGPWITEEMGMQTVVKCRTGIRGGRKVSLTLPVPDLPVYGGWGNSGRKATYYKDIAVMAVPAREGVIPDDIIDLTEMMDSDGKLEWDAPAGPWTVFRIGHAPTMSNPHPLPDDLIGKVLEADKMNADVSAFHWDNVLGPLKEHLGEYFGKSFTHILIDSYEAGDQDWTEGFREKFLEMHGYDPVPLLALCDYDPENSLASAFKEDRDSTINRMFIDNGWKAAAGKIREAGLQMYWEPYSGQFDTRECSAIPDLPMGEFWAGGTGRISGDIVDKAKETGKTIVGAEAFTGRPETSKYTEDPEYLKHSADGAFVSGANRLFLHHWVHQPFDDRYQPGMGMGWWGTHFSRFQTWFEPGKAFFTYLSRCQMMLQQGVLENRGDNHLHRKTEGADIHFVTNPTKETLTVAVAPPDPKYGAELWDPYTGRISQAPGCDPEEFLKVTLEPDHSVFVVINHGKARYRKEKPFTVVAEDSKPLGDVWDVDFAPKLDEPFSSPGFKLQDFSESGEDRIRYFAGTATYSADLTVSKEDLGNGRRQVLDLGEMNDIAVVSVNGKEVATLWNPPFKADITGSLKKGVNRISIAVTDNWANRLIGDEQYEPDFEWGADRGPSMGRAIEAFPDWFMKEGGRPSKDRKTFVIWSYYRQDSPLQKAGLVGPVRIEFLTTD